MLFKKLLSHSPLSLVCWCAVALALAFVAVGMPRFSALPTSMQIGLQSSGEEQKAYWKSRIGAVGSTRAYQEFGESAATQQPAHVHTAAHYFGAALYSLEGPTSVVVCGDKFLWGCFHEVVGETLAEHGLPIIGKLKEQCQMLATPFETDGCRHSLGHGLLAHLGYNEEALAEALEACKTYVPNPSPNPLGGCYSGVFMEFNLRTMADADSLKPFPLDYYHGLCKRLDEAFRPTCAAQAIQSWIVAEPSFTKTSFAAFGELCRGFAVGLVDYCFWGLGNHLPASKDMSTTEVIAYCKTTATTAREELLCRGSATTITRTLGGGEEEGICTGLSGAAYNYCDAYATGKADYEHILPLPAEYR